LNRDERGGSLRELADALDEQLAAGPPGVVLDNTYLTRAARSYAIDAAMRHGFQARCIWIDTPLAQAQVNLVERLLERVGRLPTPEELRVLARRGDGVLAPTSQMRALRELEPPSSDEGWASVEHVPFARLAPPHGARGGVFVAAAVLDRAGWDAVLKEVEPAAPHLVFDWRPGNDDDPLAHALAQVATAVSGPVETAWCPHGGGPPTCWCRPPLPGLPLAFARVHQLDASCSTLIGTSSAHRTLAATLGARYVNLSPP
jgi:hypothetical protein